MILQRVNQGPSEIFNIYINYFKGDGLQIRIISVEILAHTVIDGHRGIPFGLGAAPI
jgi:hypothetical protein